VAVKFPSSDFEVILAEPILIPVTNPVELTPAIVGSEEVQVTVLLLAFEGERVLVSCKVLEISKLAFVGLMDIPVTGIVSVVVVLVVKVHGLEKLLLPASFVANTFQ
jgi:hypothetical protein